MFGLVSCFHAKILDVLIYFSFIRCEHIRFLRNGIKRTQKGWQHWDRLDRVFGVWRVGSGGGSASSRQSSSSSSSSSSRDGDGSLRRIDIIVVPFLEWPFALLSWTGSKVGY
jgi:hypothetical protein